MKPKRWPYRQEKKSIPNRIDLKDMISTISSELQQIQIKSRQMMDNIGCGSD